MMSTGTSGNSADALRTTLPVTVDKTATG
jgi:hypothetical protein